MSQSRRKSKETSNGDLGHCSDAELLALTREAPEAFGVFYERHVTAVLAYISRRTPNRAVALDLTAEVFAAALAGATRYRPERAPARAWLYGIAAHKLALSRRHDALDLAARRKLGVPQFEFSDDALERVEEIVDAAGSGYLDRLRDLPAGERTAVMARIIDERDYSDIAAADRASEAAIRQRVSRGLAKLAGLRRRA